MVRYDIWVLPEHNSPGWNIGPACPASGGQPPEHNSTGADLMRIAIAKQLPDDDKKWLNIDNNE